MRTPSLHNRKRLAALAAGLLLSGTVLATGISACEASNSAREDAPQSPEQNTQQLWGACRRGKVNDPYPGECRDYRDTNGDNICDLSQPAPGPTSSLDGCPLGPCAVCGICATLSAHYL